MTQNVPFTRATHISASTAARTTTKLVLIGEDKQILLYLLPVQSSGNPGSTSSASSCTSHLPRCAATASRYAGPARSPATARSSSSNAFGVDVGLVETVAHFTRGRAFLSRRRLHHRHRRSGHQMLQDPQRYASTTSSLNEACSSGCGSFIETFARSMGYSIEDFCTLGPVCRASGRPRLALHRVYELVGQAGAEGRRDGSTISRPGCPVSVVKNAALQGHPRPFAR